MYCLQNFEKSSLRVFRPETTYAKANGETVISISDPVITLNGYHSVIGRAVVIHADADDLGLGRSEMSKSTGNSGARVACGVIGIV
ncbi:copper/zinc superoxide dismutase [Dictyocaulus viviparus]|uniref:Superoxide dismutase [Cu-Zn] n=1 Tax=Dictyocaulus viviparus TaxID=29172 RepID=A0A0D8XVV2_DICVI|nr:copper/zinc superoxide dismutase [Dictyocaulus viviparus]